MTDPIDLHLADYHTAIVPIYHLLGARLRVFDLEPLEQGHTEALLLNRDGDCALLPLSDRLVRSDGQPWERAHGAEAITLAVADLEQDGWTVFGRITITFTGHDAVVGETL